MSTEQHHHPRFIFAHASLICENKAECGISSQIQLRDARIDTYLLTCAYAMVATGVYM
jgi:hypothetical protein